MTVQEQAGYYDAWRAPRPRALSGSWVRQSVWKILAAIAVVSGGLAIVVTQAVIAVSHGQ